LRGPFGSAAAFDAGHNTREARFAPDDVQPLIGGHSEKC
jgi:hypothetical protein